MALQPLSSPNSTTPRVRFQTHITSHLGNVCSEQVADRAPSASHTNFSYPTRKT